MSTGKHTPEPWASGCITPPIFAGPTQIVGVRDGSTFILASFNHNFEQLSIANVDRAIACVNALSGIPDPAAFVARANRIEEAATDVLTWFGDGRNNPIHPNDLRELRAALAEKGGQ